MSGLPRTQLYVTSHASASAKYSTVQPLFLHRGVLIFVESSSRRSVRWCEASSDLTSQALVLIDVVASSGFY